MALIWFMFFVFLVKRVQGQDPERREPNKAVLCLQLVMISGLEATGGKLQCRGLRPLYEGLEHGGSEGVEQPAGVPSVWFVIW